MHNVWTAVIKMLLYIKWLTLIDEYHKQSILLLWYCQTLSRNLLPTVGFIILWTLLWTGLWFAIKQVAFKGRGLVTCINWKIFIWHSECCEGPRDQWENQPTVWLLTAHDRGFRSSSELITMNISFLALKIRLHSY